MTDKGPGIGKVLPGTPEVDAFLGVPYAAPPVGRLRLRPPEPHARWTTPIEATTFPQECVQISPFYRKEAGSEDCLYVEVYAPPREPGKHYPVLVNIPGGVFVGGTGGALYLDGEQAVRQSGVIEVAITYRVDRSASWPRPR